MEKTFNNLIMQSSKLRINLMLIVLALFTMSSCTTSLMTVSPEAFSNSLYMIESDLEDNGYYLTGSGEETKNEVVVTGQSYTNEAGYGTKMDNNYITYENQQFTDQYGNKIEFVVKYFKGIDYRGKGYISDIEVVRCNCDKKEVYALACSNQGIVKRRFKIAPDQDSYFYSQGKTLGLITGSTLVATLLAVYLGVVMDG